MSLPYYKRYPNDFLTATVGLTLEQKGAYSIILDLIYARDGGVPDDPRFLAGVLGCSVRKWNSLKSELIAMGKLACENGIISNFRAEKELESRRKYSSQQAENRTGSNKNKDLQKPPSNHTEQDTDTDREGGVVVGAATEFEFSELEANCRKWANGALNLALPGAHDLSPIIRLLNPSSGKPCILDDVRVGITKAAESLHARGEKVATFAYFQKPILRERDLRLKPLPEPEVHHERTGQSQSGADSNGRRGHRARPGREHRSATFGDAYERLFGGGEAPADLPDGSIDGRVERVA